MSAVVFLGPSLPRAQAEAILDADYRPPASQGDVYRAACARPAVIGLIDGYFEQAPAVWHKEILWALEQGIAVAGSASMGALRAAELAPFGMVGVGRIYRAYREGVFTPFSDPFDSDDEVAVAHGPAELGFPGGPALVDMRATLAAAADAGVIDGAARDALAARAKAQFFKDRSWARVLGRDWPGLRAWIERQAQSAKADDARVLLHRIAARDIHAPQCPEPVARTDVWLAAARHMEDNAT